MEQQVDLMEIKSADIVEAQTRSEIDVQVATAHRFPRKINEVLSKIESLACMDEETAAECFYVLRRGNGAQPIEGVSIRMAEIIASCYGNIRVQGRIVADDGKMITAQGVCIDLESNNAQLSEVKRRVTGKDGRRYSDDMVVVTCNAAIAIAKRNAIMAVVPKALVKKIFDKTKKVSMGNLMDMETRRSNCLATFAKLGVSKEVLCWYLGKQNELEIGASEIEELKGSLVAVNEGTSTIAELFLNPYNMHLEEEKAAAKADKLVDKIKAAKEDAKKEK